MTDVAMIDLLIPVKPLLTPYSLGRQLPPSLPPVVLLPLALCSLSFTLLLLSLTCIYSERRSDYFYWVFEAISPMG